MIEFKEPSILRSKLNFEPLTESSFRQNQPFVSGPVPAQVYDKALAEMTVKSTKTATETIQIFTVSNFLLMSLLTIAMQQLWGTVRALQVMLVSTLVVFTVPSNLSLFLQVCVEFANMDIFSAQNYI